MGDKERLTMTIKEFADCAGVSKNLAYSLAKKDRLGVKVIYLGKRMVLSRKSCLALLEGNGEKGEDQCH